MAPPMSPSGRPVILDWSLRGALLRYRIMAFIVGVGLIILVFIGVPLQYGADIPQVAQIVGPIHGFLYIVYLVASLDLARRARSTIWQMAAMVGAGFIPFLAFVVEHRVNMRVQPLLDAEVAFSAQNGPAA
jgi:integral membrane protein